MARVILCSELDRGSRHLDILADYAVELVAQNYTVRLVCQNLAVANKLSEFSNIAFFQAPLVSSVGGAGKMPKFENLNYSSILRNNGYHDVATLAPLLRAWLHIVGTLGADVIVAHHAPTALLAARLLKIPCIMTGTGFAVPPLTSPLSSITPWKAANEEDLMLEDQMLLQVVNDTIAEMNFPKVHLRSAKELISHAAQWIVSIPEMDHHGARDQPYVARRSSSAKHPAAEWPTGIGDRVLVHIDAESPHLSRLLEQLHLYNAPTVVVSPGVSQDLVQQYQETNVKIQQQPVNIRRAVDKCKVFINDAEHDLVHELLSYGVPSIFLPSEPENKLLAYRIVKQKLGFTGSPMPGELDVPSLIRANSEQDQVWHNAAGVALKLEDHENLLRLHSVIKSELVVQKVAGLVA